MGEADLAHKYVKLVRRLSGCESSEERRQRRERAVADKHAKAPADR